MYKFLNAKEHENLTLFPVLLINCQEILTRRQRYYGLQRNQYLNGMVMAELTFSEQIQLLKQNAGH